jgi:hypothetical protein
MASSMEMGSLLIRTSRPGKGFGMKAKELVGSMTDFFQN